MIIVIFMFFSLLPILYAHLHLLAIITIITIITIIIITITIITIITVSARFGLSVGTGYNLAIVLCLSFWFCCFLAVALSSLSRFTIVTMTTLSCSSVISTRCHGN